MPARNLVSTDSSVEGVTGAAKDVFNLVADELFDCLASWPEILARIELFGIFPHCFADSGGHGQAQIGIDVDLGAAGSASNFDVAFRNAGGVSAELTPVFVN